MRIHLHYREIRESREARAVMAFPYIERVACPPYARLILNNPARQATAELHSNFSAIQAIGDKPSGMDKILRQKLEMPVAL